MYNLGVSTLVDKASCGTTSRRSSGSTSRPTWEHDKALRACTLLAERLTPVEVSWAAGRVEDWSRARLSISAK
jgi:hypothetical protein